MVQVGASQCAELITVLESFKTDGTLRCIIIYRRVRGLTVKLEQRHNLQNTWGDVKVSELVDPS
jgi:hypothetical protein